VHSRKKLLKTFKAFFPFDLYQRVFVPCRDTGRVAGTTSDFENVMLGSKIEPRDESIVFLYRGPTVLANVATESFLTDPLKNLFGEMAVRAVKEINAFRHGEGISECGLITQLLVTTHGR
jgi:hypothetical protein